jgi:hypothetical protein
MNERRIPAGEKPRSEPEIIPPDRGDRQSRSSEAGIRVFLDGSGVRHIYIARLGPLGMVVLALMIGILLAITLVLVLGAFLIWIPLLVCWSLRQSSPVSYVHIFANRADPSRPGDPPSYCQC